MARTKIGYCKYCGNSRMIEEPEDTDHELDQEEIDRIATWECDCKAAQKARRIEEERLTCVDNIKGLIYDDYPDIAEIMTESIPLVQTGDMTKLVINTGDDRRLTMKECKEGILVRKEWTEGFEVTT